MRVVLVLTLVLWSAIASAADLRISGPCEPGTPWSVPGEHGAVFGRQNGVFEAWNWPVKMLSDFRISAELQDYPVPIDVNALAARIDVTPSETVITYSHAAFTVKQHAFAARGKQSPGLNAGVYFEIESIRPLKLTFSFTPDMLRMWPAPNFGRPDGEWVKQAGSGFYILHTDNPQFSGLVAMPDTQPGIMPPYQEHPQRYPLQLRLSFDPKRDDGKRYPLLMAMKGEGDAASQVQAMTAAFPKALAATNEYYAHFFDNRTVVESPDPRVNEAARWAEIALDQMQVGYHGEIGMVAGYYMSADSARPGFAWFFGRDTLFSIYAIDSYGDFPLARTALDFLIHRQRDDGKIMHEFSQSADAIDWKSTPYFYASADATPLFIMTLWDYVRTSGDTAYLKANWDAIKKAYSFMQAHESPQGIYDNREGTGWVESWPPTMPRQEIYLAVLDQQSMDALSRMAAVMSDTQLASEAASKAKSIKTTVESTYYEPSSQFYAFSRNPDGSLDHTASIYPSVAWWDGTLALEHAGPMLTRWASPEFSTDWGTRDISVNTPFYDPISYHQGSVWPLFTGWTSLAEYRAGRTGSAYAHLMQNLNMTWSQDLGSVTELLSGEFFAPLGRSTAHQMWSSAMVLTPLLRGLFGLSWDAQNNKMNIDPRLPAEWKGAKLHNVHLGSSTLDITYTRDGSRMKVSLSSGESFYSQLPPIEIGIATELPPPGAQTAELKILDQTVARNSAMFTLAAMAGSEHEITVRANVPDVTTDSGAIESGRLKLHFPEGTGYQTKTVTFHWTHSAK